MIWRKWAVVAALFLTTIGLSYANSSSPSQQVPTGILKGELHFPEGRAGSHPFLLAYNAAYGEQVIPLQEHDLTAGFEIKLKAGTYYLFVALDGYEPTCHVAEILEGQVVVYNPTLEPGGMISDYYVPIVKTIWQLPLRRSVQGFEISPLPPK
jgi:hypothetical protein